MTKEEIWEKLETEIKMRGYSPLTFGVYKTGICPMKGSFSSAIFIPPPPRWLHSPPADSACGIVRGTRRTSD